ncbi:MAG: hypothetical protein ACKVOJ_09230 [Sphingomonadaceae bacterium]
MLDQSSELTINATAFKARCLGLMDELTRGRLKRVLVTKRGKVVAEMSAPEPTAKKISIIGCMAKDVAAIDWDAIEREAASLHNEWPTPEEMDADIQRQLNRAA